MEKTLAFIITIISLAYGLYNAKKGESQSLTIQTNYKRHIETHHIPHYEEELKKLHTTNYTKQYIIDVINHGSDQLHFKPTEIMDAGFAFQEDAPKIACYVLELSGKSCNNPSPKDASMYYSSNCAGCHGEDAKGLHGTYPDLTKEVLLGVEKRKQFLKKMLK